MEIIFSGSSIGAGAGVKVLEDIESRGFQFEHVADWSISPTGATKVSLAKIMIQGSPDDSGAPSGLATSVNGDGAVLSPSLGVGSTPENISHGLFPYRVGGVSESKAANAVGVAFSAAHKIAASKFGAIAVYIASGGAITTVINSAAQTDTLSFDTAQLAIDNVLASDFPHTTDAIRIGYILIGNNGSLWTAITDDLTDTSDVTTASFYNTTSSYTEIDEYVLNSDDLDLQKGVFYVDAALPDQFIRYVLSELTGDGTFTVSGKLMPFRRTHTPEGS